jgi:hypothetical protein
MSENDLGGLRRLGVPVVLVAATVFFAEFVDRFYPLRVWLVWRYLLYWVIALGLVASCWSAGDAILRRLFAARLPLGEQLTFALPVGVLAFQLAIFCLGLVHFLNVVTFFALPALLLLAGGPLVADVRAWWRGCGEPFRWTLDVRVLPVLGLAWLAIAFLYFQILSPEVFAFDVRWYHVPIAQRYALSGAIRPFQEGFWMGTWPHSLSYLYAWVFLAPGLILFDRVETCAHIEFVLFLATLAQIPVFVRRLVPDTRAGLTWAVLLAFPSIYLYDGNLHAGADHFAGFWAIPVALALQRTWNRFTAPNAVLSAMCVAGVALTKYTALPIAATAAVCLVARGAWLAARREERSLAPLALFVSLAAVLTAPHWLKNWIWYGDPAYPWLRKYLTVHPWSEDAGSRLAAAEALRHPGGPGGEGLFRALRATVTFSFVPHDWEFLHRDVPVFGSLFTLTLPCLVFLRGGKRLVWVYAWVMSIVFCWYMLAHYDRYLQAVLPAMAAATAGCLALAWRHGWAARAGVVLLVAFQVIWGSDVPFFRTHNLVNDSPVRVVAAFLASGFERKENRLMLFEPLQTVGRTLPRDAVVLAHEIVRTLGLDRNWVSDFAQTRLSYARLVNPAAIHAELVDMGVTHVVWPDWSLENDSIAADLAFLNYALNYTVDQRHVESYTTARLPRERPADNRADYDVAYFGCGQPYARGWYRLSQLTLPPLKDPGPAPAPRAELTDTDDAFTRAAFVVVDTSCADKVAPGAPFVLASTRAPHALYVRSR